MGISLQEALKLNGFNNAVIRAGHDGLYRVVRWVHVADVPEAAEWVQGGELLFITGIGIKKNTEALVGLVRALAAKCLAGLVINTGPYIKEIPQRVLDVADELSFPVLELPWKVKLVDITHTICSRIVAKQMEEKSLLDLLDSLINGDAGNREIVINRAASYGLDLTREHMVLIVDIDNFEEYIKKHEVKDEESIQSAKTSVRDMVLRACSARGIKALAVVKSDKIIVVLQLAGLGADDLRKLADEMRGAVFAADLGFTVSVGIGPSCGNFSEIPASYTEANNALYVAKINHRRNSTVGFQEIGFYRLFFQVRDCRELEKFFLDSFGKIIGDENSRENELFVTLQAYIELQGNLQKTAEKLFIHKNTLKYRLKKIESILGIDLGDQANNLNLAVGLAVGRFINLC